MNNVREVVVNCYAILETGEISKVVFKIYLEVMVYLHDVWSDKGKGVLVVAIRIGTCSYSTHISIIVVVAGDIDIISIVN